MVRKGGLEAPCPCGRSHLKAVRLPIPPPPRGETYFFCSCLAPRAGSCNSRVLAILSGPVLCQRLAAAARQTAETRFAADLVIPRYEAIYGSLAGRDCVFGNE